MSNLDSGNGDVPEPGPTRAPMPSGTVVSPTHGAPVLATVLLTIEAGVVVLLLIGGALALVAYAGGSEPLAWLLAAVLVAVAAGFIPTARAVIRSVRAGRLWAVVVAGAVQTLWIAPAIGSGGMVWWGAGALLSLEVVLLTGYLRRADEARVGRDAR